MSAPTNRTRHSGKQRVLIIGIDGATLDVIRPLVEQGRLPYLERLMSAGCWGPLRTVFPPVTAPAWTSFMTGVNPGRHGIYDFRYRKAGTYELATNNTTANHAPMLWEVLSLHGKRCCVINVPATYPPRPLNGECVTGLLTPADAPVFTYPPELTQEILRAIPGYEVWPASMFHPKGREREFLAATDELIRMQVRLFHFLQRNNDWDFQIIVFGAPDIVQHEMWHYRDPSHPLHDPAAPEEFRLAIDRCYQIVDSAIGELLESAGENTHILIISDHGFGPADDWFHTNAWLISEGFLVLKPHVLSRLKKFLYDIGITPLNVYEWALKLKLSKSVAHATRHRREETFAALRRFFLSFDDVDWSRTTAYSIGNVGAIFINLAGREPEGSVRPSDYDIILHTLSARLRTLVNPRTGAPLVEAIHYGKNLYRGRWSHLGPDILMEMAQGRVCAYGNTEFASRHWLTPSNRTGWHRMDGILIAAGPLIHPQGEVFGSHLLDIYPTIMAIMGLPVPADLDGRVLEHILSPEAQRSLHYDKLTVEEYFHLTGRGHISEGYTPEEEAAVAGHLKGLGYV